jgi:hypothetical protein
VRVLWEQITGWPLVAVVGDSMPGKIDEQAVVGSEAGGQFLFKKMGQACTRDLLDQELHLVAMFLCQQGG